MHSLRWELPDWKWTETIFASDMKQVIPWGINFAGINLLYPNTMGEGELIGLLDTGCDVEHVDLKGRIHGAIDMTGSAYGVQDRQGHGTHTAGTIASEDNGQGVIGVAPKAKLFIVKVLGDNGSGSSAQLAAGIRRATKEGCTIISMSLGSPDGDPDVKQALLEFISTGGLVVCAAGNRGLIVRNGETLNTVDYPAKWTDIALAVGAYDEKGVIAPFSARGPEVDVMAPGVNILSTWPNNRYAYLQGTSMATPFVAGSVALIQAWRKKNKLPRVANQSQLEAELRATSSKSENAAYPMLNAKGMFDYIKVPAPVVDAPKETDPNAIVLGPVNIADFVSVQVTLTLLGGAAVDDTTNLKAAAESEAALALSSVSLEALCGELAKRIEVSMQEAEVSASGIFNREPRDPNNPRFPAINALLKQFIEQLGPKVMEVLVPKLPELLLKLLNGITGS